MAGLASRLIGALRGAAAPSAAEWLRNRRHFGATLPDGPLVAQPYVVFDLESTGLAPSRGDAIVQIGAVRLRNAEIVESFTTLVNPGRPIPAISTKYHGVTEAMVVDAPREAEAVARFLAFCGEDVLVAHNAGFDQTLLHMAEFRGGPPMGNAMLCSMAASRWLDPQESDHSLDGIATRMNIVIEGRHEALGDALATAEIWLRLIARASALGVEHLPELTRRAGMQRFVDAAAEHF
jgi:DNA polymerase III epsilon subunit family exonuclease